MNLSLQHVGIDRLFGAALVVIGVAVMLSTGMRDGQPARYINVRWQSDVSVGMRAGIQERFSLWWPRQGPQRLR